MNKVKYLHRKGRDIKKWKYKKNYTKDNFYGEKLPYHESIRNKHKRGWDNYWCYNNGLDFTPVGYYIEEHINCKWNDIYSKILKKIKPKNRWMLNDYLSWYICTVHIVDYTPYLSRYHSNKIAYGCLFIDEDGILRKYNSEKEIKEMTLKKIRRDKLLKLKKIFNESD